MADDHGLIAEGFTKLLDPRFEIVDTVADGAALLELAPESNPDVVLLALTTSLINGTEVGERLKRLLPRTKIIVFAITEDPDIAAEVLRSWASGLLLKKSSALEASKAIREVLRGKKYVTPRMRAKLLDAFVRGRWRNRGRTLTPRQKEVLQLLTEGHTMREVADILHVAPRTVAFHKYRLMASLGLKTNSDLLRFAIREHLVPLT